MNVPISCLGSLSFTGKCCCMFACKSVMIKGVHLNVGTSIAFVWDMMNTTEIEVNDNDAAPLSSVSPASSFRDSSPTHN